MKCRPSSAVVGVLVGAFLLATTRLPLIAVLGLAVGSAFVFQLKRAR